MTDNNTTASATPLVSDARISQELGIVVDAMLDYPSSFNVGLDVALKVCDSIRDEYQAKLLRLAQQLTAERDASRIRDADLTGELELAQEEIERGRARYEAAIEDAQAGATVAGEAWQSVTRVDCACGEPGCPKHVRLEPSYEDEPPTLWYLAPDGYEDMMYLPAGQWELCKRTTAISVAQGQAGEVAPDWAAAPDWAMWAIICMSYKTGSFAFRWVFSERRPDRSDYGGWWVAMGSSTEGGFVTVPAGMDFRQVLATRPIAQASD